MLYMYGINRLMEEKIFIKYYSSNYIEYHIFYAKIQNGNGENMRNN